MLLLGRRKRWLELTTAPHGAGNFQVAARDDLERVLKMALGYFLIILIPFAA